MKARGLVLVAGAILLLAAPAAPADADDLVAAVFAAHRAGCDA